MQDVRLIELADLYHIARVAGAITRYERLSYAAREYADVHPEVNINQAYKLACRAID